MDLRPLNPDDWLTCDYGWRRHMIEAHNIYHAEYQTVIDRKKKATPAPAPEPVQTGRRGRG